MTDSVILLEKEIWWHLVILRFLIKKKLTGISKNIFEQLLLYQPDVCERTNEQKIK